MPKTINTKVVAVVCIAFLPLPPLAAFSFPREDSVTPADRSDKNVPEDIETETKIVVRNPKKLKG